MIKYRVYMKISYYDACFEFNDAEDAVVFAKTMLEHQVSTEDTKKKPIIQMQVVDVDAEKMAESEDE